MLTYKEFRKKLLTELDQRGIKFEITSMTSVNGERNESALHSQILQLIMP